MAITGKFVADFTDFDRGVQGAVPKLLSFQAAADKAGGRLMDLGQKGQDAAPRIGGLTDSMHQFDSALAAAGLHIGPQIRAIGELSAAASAGAGALSGLAKGGLITAAALQGIQFGRMIADFTGSDKIIGDAAATLFGWSKAATNAGVIADALALASQRSGREITKMAEAIKINNKWGEDFVLVQGRSRDAVHDTMEAVSGWQREIRAVRKNGDFEQLTVDMDSQNFTLKELSKKYGIHIEALQYLTRQTKAAADVQQAANDARKKAAEEVAAAEKEAVKFTADRWKQQLDIEVKILDSTAKQTAAYLALTNDGVLKELAAQQELTKGVDVAVTAMDRLTAAQKALQATKIAGFSIAAQEQVLMNTFGQELMDDAAAEHTARVKAAELNTELAKTPAVVNAAGASAVQAASSFFQMSEGLYSAIRAAQLLDEASNRFGKQIFGSTIGGIAGSGLQGFADGGPVLKDGPIYAHAGEYVLPKGGAGGGITVIIQGSVLSTEAALARLVEAAFVRARRAGGGRIAA